MTKTITVSDIIPAAAADIYSAWLDSVAHAAMTGGGKAEASPEVGAPFSAWDGYISGLNLALSPGERIEQSWRSTDFTPGDEDSTLTVLLEPADGGTKVTLIHSGVPDQLADFAEGWRQYYFEPMKSYFAALMEPMTEAPVPMAEPAAKKPATRKAAAKKPAAKKPAARTAAAKKPAAKKPAAKKAAANKKPASARKSAAKKPAARKAASARPAAKKKPSARKPAARKVAKKSAARKPSARKLAAKKPARKGRR